MTCEEARKNLPLFLYGELSFDEEELVEVHVDECAACRHALAREKAMFAALDGVELVPSPAALAESRSELRRRLAMADCSPRTMNASGSGFWDKIREGFTIHFHFAPGIAQEDLRLLQERLNGQPPLLRAQEPFEPRAGSRRSDMSGPRPLPPG